MEKPLIISKTSFKRNPRRIANSSVINCDEATVEDTLYILHTKDLIDENLKLLSGNNKLVDDEILLTPLSEDLMRLLKIQINFLILFQMVLRKF